jgi:ABC-2 type transport system permease protein
VKHDSDRRILWAVVRRDLLTLVGSKATALPLLLLPLVLFAGLPLLVSAAPDAVNLPVTDVDTLTEMLPGASAAALPADPDVQLTYLMLVYLLAPMLLIVPVTLSVIAAAGAIAGERERRTLEILLLSPITDRQFFVAKTLGAWLPAVALTLVGSVVYQLVATLALAATGIRPFPNLLWTLLILWVAPALAAAALGAVVVLSARAKTSQDAMQLGAFLILPLVAIAVAQATGLLALGAATVAASGLALWLVAALLLRAGTRSLQRDRLVTRL